MKRPVLIAALSSALALGGVGMLSSAWAQEATDQAAPADTAAEAAPVTIQDMAQGAEDAPVTIVEYGSFTCPHCAAFHADQYQHLKEDYIDTGKVRFVFREVYFDRFGLWASMIARCGGEMRFFGISDILYDTQRDWIGEGEPAQIAENLRRIGKSAGMDDATLDACLNNEAQAEALVAWYQENAERDGIQSTPTFIINGESHSNMAYDDLKSIIDSELAETQ
nr:DsbA family protein [Rubellimicrobium arenae]